MSYSVDVNVLLSASDRWNPRHKQARRFVEDCAAGPEVFWPTLMSYVRIATHPRIFAAPLSPDEAVGNVAALLGLPHVRAVSELDVFLDAYRRITGDTAIRGNLVPDVHLAAMLFQPARSTPNDRDFRRFRLLDVQDPIS